MDWTHDPTFRLSPASGGHPLGNCAAQYFKVQLEEENDGTVVVGVKPSDSHPGCPITCELIHEPVMTCDGHVYEKEAIVHWFTKGRQTSPLTNLQLMNKDLRSVKDFGTAVEAFIAQSPEMRTLVQKARVLPQLQQETDRLRSHLTTQEQSWHDTCLPPSKRLHEAMQSVRDHPTAASEENLRSELLLAEEEIVTLIDAIGLARTALGLGYDAWGKKVRCQLRRALGVGTAAARHEDTPAPAVSALETTALKNLRATMTALPSLDSSAKVDGLDIFELQAQRGHLAEAILAARQAGAAEEDLCLAEDTRRRIHNVIERLKGTVRVFCRVRPLSAKEVANGEECVVETVDSTTVCVGGVQYLLDAVFTPAHGQDAIFEDCRDLVQSAMDGNNITLFAYGQTGAGKTYTTYGTPERPGLAPRIVQEIYRIVDRDVGHLSYTISASMLELYRNDLVDLLQVSSRGRERAKKASIRHGKDGELHLDNAEERQCGTADALWDLIQVGSAARTVMATAMNSESSRSHLIVIIRVHGVNRKTQQVLNGKIFLCDLAGSERISRSRVSGDGVKEAIEINKSLTALGDVIEALTKGHQRVPYRNHKLTEMMKDSLGGKSQTLMFVTCSSSSSNMVETQNSLRWATRAKHITNARV